MTSPLDRARRRQAQLEAELKQIQQFIQMYEAFDSASDEDQEQNKLIASDTVSSVTSPITTTQAVHNSPVSRRRNGRSGPTPKEIVDIVERMIRDAGRPLTRGDITDLLEARDVEIPASDKARYVGTIMWRQKGKFINIEGRGYWLRGEALPVRRAPSAGPPPAQDDEPEEYDPDAYREQSLESGDDLPF